MLRVDGFYLRKQLSDRSSSRPNCKSTDSTLETLIQLIRVNKNAHFDISRSRHDSTVRVGCAGVGIDRNDVKRRRLCHTSVTRREVRRVHPRFHSRSLNATYISASMASSSSKGKAPANGNSADVPYELPWYVLRNLPSCCVNDMVGSRSIDRRY